MSYRDEEGETAQSSAFNCTIDAYTDGSVYRAHVRAKLREKAPGVFTITPFYFREISGPMIEWQTPSRGEPIITLKPITSLDEAHQILVWWASVTFAHSRETLEEKQRTVPDPAPSPAANERIEVHPSQSRRGIHLTRPAKLIRVIECSVVGRRYDGIPLHNTVQGSLFEDEWGFFVVPCGAWSFKQDQPVGPHAETSADAFRRFVQWANEECTEVTPATLAMRNLNDALQESFRADRRS